MDETEEDERRSGAVELSLVESSIVSVLKTVGDSLLVSRAGGWGDGVFDSSSR